jgi:Undecaprenyl-phosphate galactose phosphotransferase WbaP
MPGLPARELSERVRRYSRFFESVLVVPAMPGAAAQWSTTQRMEGLLGYRVRHCSRRRVLQGLKRVVDVALASAGLVVLSPLLAGIAVLIKLDSPGPVLFRQERLGMQGRCFPIYKFRSMYTDAEARLHDLLAERPDLRAEYARYHKLQQDPRVTPIGRLLRTYSLDELPQLANVLMGHLSLVGPRAFLPSELREMDGLERAVLQARPGITGLWQVSGRNRLPFAERLTMDVHYAQNWTPWLDLYILAKTLPVVLCGEGR